MAGEMKLDGSNSEDKQLLIDIPDDDDDDDDVSEKIAPLIKRKRHAILYRYTFFLFMNACMILAFFTSRFGGTKGFIDGNFFISNVAIPLIYLEAGFNCNTKSFLHVLKNGYLLLFITSFVYFMVPVLARMCTLALSQLTINVRLLKGIEVLHCLPPPLTSSLVLSRISNADLPTSVITSMLCHLVGLVLTPTLLHLMLGVKTSSLKNINFRPAVQGTIVPLIVGIALQKLIRPKRHLIYETRGKLISQIILLLVAYNLFCDAFTMDAASLYAFEILLTVFIACFSQIFVIGLFWFMSCKWLSHDLLLATLYTCTFKSIGFGEFLVKTTFKNNFDIQGPAVNLPLGILTVAQLLFGSLMASWLAP